MPSTTRAALVVTDIAVIGGVVAGSSVAAALAQSGLGVVLVEREARFRDRVRGEGIHPWGVKEIHALGLAGALCEAGAHVLPNWQTYDNRAPLTPFCWDDVDPGTPGEWSMYHPALQDALFGYARTCGVTIFRPARVTRFTRAAKLHLEVVSEDATYDVRARLVIGADGRQSATRRWIGAKTIEDPVHHWIGGCLLDGVALPDDHSHVAVFEGGAVLLWPQGGGRARSYLIGKDPVVGAERGLRGVTAYLGRCAAVFPEGALTNVKAAGPLAFFPNADVWSDRLCDDRIVLIGDAAGANDPSQGQGLSLCFRDARELRDHLLGEANWKAAVTAYADRRMAYFGVLRAQAQWRAALATDVGPEADARRAAAGRAAELDPELGGFSAKRILSRGPDGLIADEAARRHFFGEDLDDSISAPTAT